MNELVDVPFQYAARGWRVIPLHAPLADGGCTCGDAHTKSPGSIGKHPRHKDWPTKASADLKVIAGWQRITPGVNFGVVTGAVSGIFALDIDPAKGGEQTLAALIKKHGALPRTVEQLTGSGGRHLLFKHPGGVLRNGTDRLGPGLDIRGDGGQIVVAPSRHHSGGFYEWQPECAPWETESVEAPSWLLELARPAEPAPAIRDARATAAPDAAYRRAQAYLAKIPGALSGSNGHGQTWTAALAVVRGFRLTESEAFALLWSDYNPRCTPPWSEEEVSHKVADAASNASVPYGYLLDVERSGKQAAAPARVAAATTAVSAEREAPGCDDDDETPVAAARGWPELIPFERPYVPPFPTDVLPDWQRKLVEAVALETETAPDLAALAVLSAQATVCARRFQIEQRPDFMQPVNLWTLSLLKSGGRKSRVFSLATAPLSAWQLRKHDELKDQIASEASAKRRLEQKLKRAEKAAAEAKSAELRAIADVEADEIAKQLASFEVTRAPVLFVTEGTPERIEEMLAEQGERMAILSDEAGMLNLLGGRYSKGAPNLSALLVGHDGGAVRVGRKRHSDGTGGDRMLDYALVTFGLSVQPDVVVNQLRAQASFFDSGFAWRFLFALVPSSLGERTHGTPATPQAVREEYSDKLGELLDLPAPIGLEFPTVRMTPEATAALIEWERTVQEPKLREGGELGRLESWGSKLASRLCRIAGLFHAAEHRRAPWNFPLELATMERALSLAPYFTAHAKAVGFELQADGDMRTARRALDWIRRERLPSFNRREMHRAIASHERVDAVDRPLRVLEERCFIRQVSIPPGESGGRPSLAFHVNPAALAGTR
jgi:hypothetical protein